MARRKSARKSTRHDRSRVWRGENIGECVMCEAALELDYGGGDVGVWELITLWTCNTETFSKSQRSGWERRQDKNGTKCGESDKTSRTCCESGQERQMAVSRATAARGGKHCREQGQERQVGHHCCESGLTRMILATACIYIWRRGVEELRSSAGFFYLFFFILWEKSGMTVNKKLEMGWWTR